MSSINLTEFKNPTKLARWVKGLSYFCIGANLLAIVAGYLEYEFYQNSLHGLFVGEEQADAAQDMQETWVAIAGVLQSAIIFQVIALLFWVYRINKNTRTLDPTIKNTPAWSVAWFLIPIVNVWKPYYVLKEIWLANHKSIENVRKKNTAFIVIFWICAVISLSLGQGAFRYSFKANELSEFILANKLMLLSDFADIFFLICTIILVSKMNKVHLQKFTAHANECRELSTQITEIA